MPTSADLLFDTSTALALLMPSNPAHEEVVRVSRHLRRGMAGHAHAELYSVLTRLPDPYRLRAADAARAIARAFPSSAALPADVAVHSVQILADAGITGGAVYDGLVALAARNAKITLLSHDRRALPTYAALGVDVRLI